MRQELCIDAACLQGGVTAKRIQEPWGSSADEAPAERRGNCEESHFDPACPPM